MSRLDGVGGRLGDVINNLGLSQNDFADRLGISQGFVSDVVRSNKRPGAELLFALRDEFGVSVDWLLTGEGTMYGGNPVELELFKLIAAQIALARAATVQGDSKAASLVRRILNSGDANYLADPEVEEALRKVGGDVEETMLAAVLYNSHLWTAKRDERVRNALSGALAHFQAKRPLDILDALKAGRAASSAGGSGITQHISGKSVRAAGRDYHERSKRPRKS